jgi:hypothetical protein
VIIEAVYRAEMLGEREREIGIRALVKKVVFEARFIGPPQSEIGT